MTPAASLLLLAFHVVTLKQEGVNSRAPKAWLLLPYLRPTNSPPSSPGDVSLEIVNIRHLCLAGLQQMRGFNSYIWGGVR